MNKFLEDAKVTGVALELTHRCTLKCASCFRQKKDYIHEKRDITDEDFEKLTNFFDQYMTFTGQMSDAIFHPKLAEFLKITHEKNIKVEITTAASHKKQEEWENFFAANPNARWIFCIDGLPKYSSIYRKNQDGEFMYEMMLLAKNKYKLNVVWKYIVFEYNENDVFTCGQLAKKHGIDFKVSESGRGITPESTFEETTGNVDELDKLYQHNPNFTYTFKPKCIGYDGKRKDKVTSTTNHLLPCCWCDQHRHEIPELTQEHLKIHNVDKIEDIILSDEWNAFEKRLETGDPPKFCKKYCGYGGNFRDDITLYGFNSNNE
mgnify:CR=1 FL=1